MYLSQSPPGFVARLVPGYSFRESGLSSDVAARLKPVLDQRLNANDRG